jgi:hypothetical protein
VLKLPGPKSRCYFLVAFHHLHLCPCALLGMYPSHEILFAKYWPGKCHQFLLFCGVLNFYDIS